MGIRELREKTGLTQKEFAKKYELQLGQVRSWEQGWRNTPKSILYMLNRLVKIDFGDDADESNNELSD